MDVGEYLIASLIAGLILWQLVTGKVLDRSWRVGATRQGSPITYWLVILGQCVILALFLFVDWSDD